MTSPFHSIAALSAAAFLSAIAPASGAVAEKPVPPGMVSETRATRMTGLHNGEEILVPDELLQAVGPLQDELKAKLSPADYLAILKGEVAWYVKRKQPGQKPDYSDLIGKLKAILANPGDHDTFRWPRYVPEGGKDGVHYVAAFGDLEEELEQRSEYDQRLSQPIAEVGYADNRYYFASTSTTDVDVYETKTDRKIATLSLPTAPDTMSITRLPGSEMYFLTFTTYPAIARWEPFAGPALVGTWQDTETGFACIVDPAAGAMQTFMFGEKDPKAFYDPYKCDMFVRSKFPFKQYLALDDEGSERYAFRRTGVWKDEEHNRSRGHHQPHWGGWDDDKKHTSVIEYDDDWYPDDLYCDKNAPKGHMKHLIQEHLPLDRNAGKLDFSTLSRAVPGNGTLQTLGRDTLKKLGGKMEMQDACSSCRSINTYDKVDAIQSDKGHTVFSFHIPMTVNRFGAEIDCTWCGIIAPDGRIKVFDKKQGGIYVPFRRKDFDYEKMPEVIMTPLAAIATGGDKLSVVWKCTPQVEQEGMHSYVVTQEIDFESGKVRELSRLAQVPEGVDPASGRLVSKVNDHHFRLLKLDAKGETSDADAIDYYVRGNDYALVLPDGRYCGSPGCESMLDCTKDGRSISMKALAPWRNRPAAVLQALGGDPDAIAALQSTTERWLARKGVQEGDPEPAISDFPVAEVTIPELENKEGVCTFNVRLQATKRPLTRIHVTLGGVERQVAADALPLSPGSRKDINISIPLVPGHNWIEVYAEDADGRVGNATRFRSVHTGKEPGQGTRYVVCIGVSEYDDEALRLQFAAKDAKDVADTFQAADREHVRPLLLQDKDVRGDVMERVREFLAQAKPEDSVVVYLAGHGMLNASMDYYFAPSGFNPEDIEGTGIPMDAILEAVGSTPALQRLLLLDTCHSGMLGEEGEEKMALAMGDLPKGVRAIQTRGMKVKKTPAALTGNKQKRYIEELFSMNDAVSGINVISGASGAEFALESGEWKNGVFTSALLEAIIGTKEADANTDGRITVPELASYLQQRVSAQTNGAQRPTANLLREGNAYTVSMGFCPLVPEQEKAPKEEWEPLLQALKRIPPLERSFSEMYPALSGKISCNASPDLKAEINRLTGETAQDIANEIAGFARYDDPDIPKLRKLLEHHPDVDLPDKEMYGTTCLNRLCRDLSHCLENGNAPTKERALRQAIQMLLDAGADPKKKDNQGICALDYEIDIPGLDNAPRLEEIRQFMQDYMKVCGSDSPTRLEEECEFFCAASEIMESSSIKPGNKPYTMDDLFATYISLTDTRAYMEELAEKCPRRIRTLTGEIQVESMGGAGYRAVLDCECEYTYATGGTDRVRERLISLIERQPDGKPKIRRQAVINSTGKYADILELNALLLQTSRGDFDDTELERCIHNLDTYAQDGKPLLHIACERGAYLACKWLLEHGANPNARDSHGKPAKDYIHPLRNAKMLKPFLGISYRPRTVDLDTSSPQDSPDDFLRQAAQHAEAHVHWLNSHDNSSFPTNTPAERVEVLVKFFAPTVDYFGNKGSSHDFIRRDILDTASKYPLREVSRAWDVEAEWAAADGGKGLYRVALTCSCDYTANDRSKSNFSVRNHYIISFASGQPLITAIKTVVNPQKDTQGKELKLLIDGFNLSYAGGSSAVFKQYLSGGKANMSKTDAQGRTILHHASAQGRLLLCKWLLEHGANPAARDKSGKLPSDLVPDCPNQAAIKNLFSQKGY